MSEQEEFEAIVYSPPYEKNINKYDSGSAWPEQYRDYSVQFGWDMWQACAEQKDKEIAALRDFSQLVVESGDFLFIRLAKSLNLIDESGNPTPLLTGESK